ncbi:MAG: conjugal transfer protein TraF [Planctomycetota bacterium]
MRNRLVPTLALAAAALPALALDHVIVGPRALGMAGANVASTRDTTAQFYNPGAFGFFGAKQDSLPGEDGKPTAVDPQVYESDNQRLGERDFGLHVDALGSYRLTGRIGDLVAEAEDIGIDELSELGSGSGLTRDDVDRIVRLSALLAEIDEDDYEIQIMANAGGGLRFGPFAIGARAYTHAAGLVREIDRENLGLDFSGVAEFDQDLQDLNAQEDLVPADYQNQYIVPGSDSYQRLSDIGISDESISVLDVRLGNAVDNGNVPTFIVDQTITELENLAEQVDGVGGGGPLDENRTAVTALGLAYVEVPVTYGYAINEHVAIGGSVKYMQGRQYATTIRIFDEDLDQVVEDSEEYHEESTAFGVDLGVMARMPNFQAGIVARNVNSPTFDGFTFTDPFGNPEQVPDRELDPTISIGGAWIPSSQMTVEVGLDVTAQDSLYENYETQMVRAGVEFDLLHFLALRGGIMNNLSESDVGPIVTAGFGLNLWLLRFDLAAGASLETSDYDGSEYPSEGYVALAVTGEF